jgi:UrcA family protein
MSSLIASTARITRKVVAALLATTAAAVPASYAQSLMTVDQTPSVTVKYSDLNLATDQGSRALYSRLVNAAERVCPVRGTPMELSQNRRREACITTAVQNAAKEVKNPKFAEVAASKLR